MFRANRIRFVVKGLFVLASIAGAAFSFGQKVSVDAEPLFRGGRVGADAPLVIHANSADATKGEVRIVYANSVTHIPLTLESNKQATVIAYPSAGIDEYYEGRMLQIPKVVLETDLGKAEHLLGYPDPTPMQRTLIICDARTTSLFASSKDVAPAAFTAMITPQELPTRPSVYRSFDLVAVGPGAEKMSDLAFNALQNYLLTGGTLVFSGRNSVAAQDSRWRALFGAPAQDTRTVPFGTGCAIITYSDELFKRNNTPLVRQKLIQDYITSNSAHVAQDLLTAHLTRSDYPINGDAGVASAGNPFKKSMPSLETIVGMMVLFFLIVVPVNLLVLKKFGKGEWAWLTAPVISLGFAAMFFRFAGGLYSASLSKQNSGLIMADSRAPSSYYMGNTEMFFPKGGTYDLKLSNVEAVGDLGTMGNYSALASVNPIDIYDNGKEITMPRTSVRNLSFHKWAFEQLLPQQTWITGHVKFLRYKMAGTIKNTSKYRLTNCKVHCGTISTALSISSLEPGQSANVADGFPRYDDKGFPSYDDSQRQIGGAMETQYSKKRIMFTATVEGFVGGPQIGKEIKGTSAVELVECLGEVK